ncbi:M24 family metallopeptidase [Oceanobacillus profundus]|uniref:Aminopeptidase P family protein n=1 Tax=Oceanobacillus profundus TaxID=372463 RepID=A0A417YB21_9BACI|nr:aminopeptidase P family protein [Oceanobacillus profundus]
MISLQLDINKLEIRNRQNNYLKKLTEKKVDASILFNTTNIFYLTGFHFRPSERPIAFITDTKQKTHLFVPRLEKEHAEEYAVIDNVHYYQEYPGLIHPMEHLKEVLQANNFENKIVGLDASGYNSSKGYRGPNIANLLNFDREVYIKDMVESMRYVKSQDEIELIKESARWGNLAHTLLVKYTRLGKREIEIEGLATYEATRAMFETLGNEYRPYGSPAHAFYRGQIGPHSAFPHSQNQNAEIKHGYNVVSQAAADVWGYKSELERTMFILEVNKLQESFFQHMINVQDIAFNTIKPGIPASRIEEEVQRYYQENNLNKYIRHHTGHNMGLLNHEAPFFDLGDHTILKPGMVFSVEPGLYVEGLGAFRHSDTIVITENGMEKITYYPRDLNSLIIG